jgi:hypothetical protein
VVDSPPPLQPVRTRVAARAIRARSFMIF